MKYLYASLAAVFALFALVQYNDPDSLLWIVLYSGVAVLCGLAAFGKGSRWLTGAGMAVACVWMVALLPGFIEWLDTGMPNIAAEMKTDAPHIEVVREFLGLALSLGCLALLHFRKAPD